jgi:hypothetical protein
MSDDEEESEEPDKRLYGGALDDEQYARALKTKAIADALA